MKTQAFDFSVNLLEALLRRHNNAQALQAIMAAKQAWYDENFTAFWENWVTDVFDLRTANAFGCAVWAAILGVPLSIILDPQPGKRIFGFGPYRKNFYLSNFATSTQTLIPLTLEQKRIVLRLRYFQLISRGSIPQTNRFLAYLFRDYGGAYVLNNRDMSITYVFRFVIPAALQMVFTFFDILPRPAGVSVTVVSEV